MPTCKAAGARFKTGLEFVMDKPKPRGTNKPKSFSPSREQKQDVQELRDKNEAERTKRLGGAKPPPEGLRGRGKS